MTNSTICPVCRNSAKVLAYSGGPSDLSCPRCGEFTVGDIAAHELSTWSANQLANLSGWIRENQQVKIFEPLLRGLRTLRTPSVGEKADKLLLGVARQYPKAGTRIPLFKGQLQKNTNVASNVASFSADVLPQVMAQSWGQDAEEVIFIVIHFLLKAKHFISDADNGYFMITPDGWAYIHSLTQTVVRGDIGFIAMWFDQSMNGANVAIQSAIQAAGYTALRIDSKEHNNKIDDEIIASIRRSRFLVADFTGHRGGVYFEAGFASGLGIPVIWMCREDDLEKLHFDTRQYSHVLWNPGKLPEMQVALQRRIEATLGTGPRTTS